MIDAFYRPKKRFKRNTLRGFWLLNKKTCLSTPFLHLRRSYLSNRLKINWTESLKKKGLRVHSKLGLNLHTILFTLTESILLMKTRFFFHHDRRVLFFQCKLITPQSFILFERQHILIVDGFVNETHIPCNLSKHDNKNKVLFRLNFNQLSSLP